MIDVNSWIESAKSSGEIVRLVALVHIVLVIIIIVIR